MIKKEFGQFEIAMAIDYMLIVNDKVSIRDLKKFKEIIDEKMPEMYWDTTRYNVYDSQEYGLFVLKNTDADGYFFKRFANMEEHYNVESFEERYYVPELSEEDKRYKFYQLLKEFVKIPKRKKYMKAPVNKVLCCNVETFKKRGGDLVGAKVVIGDKVVGHIV